MDKGKKALEDLALTTKVDKVKVMKLDLVSMASVRQFVEELEDGEFQQFELL